jgi:hypothetical protein
MAKTKSNAGFRQGTDSRTRTVRLVRIFPLSRKTGEAARTANRSAISAARLTQGVPWLCVPLSRGVCLFDCSAVDGAVLTDGSQGSDPLPINNSPNSNPRATRCWCCAWRERRNSASVVQMCRKALLGKPLLQQSAVVMSAARRLILVRPQTEMLSDPPALGADAE